MSIPIADSLPAELSRFTDVVEGMGKLLVQLKIYPTGHPSVGKYLDESYDSLNIMLSNKRSIILRVVKKTLFYLNYTFNVDDENRKNFNHLIKALRLMSAGEIEIEKDLEKSELLAFMEIVASVLKGDRKFDLAGAWNKIDRIKIRHAQGKPEASEKLPDKVDAGSPVKKEIRSCDRKKKECSICGVIDDVLKKLEKIQSHDGIKAGRLILEMVGKENTNTSMVLMLKSLINYDDYTFKHSVNVAVISAATWSSRPAVSGRQPPATPTRRGLSSPTTA